VRHPFLDHRLVDLVVNLPTETKIANGWTKYILRKAIRELPDGIRWRRDKQNFLVPEQAWLQREFKPVIEECFRNSKLAAMGILDDHRFLEHYAAFCKGNAVSSSEIARILIAEMWARQYLN
jgi:asparagine synthase (glutamine-hydrolysing)